MPNSMLVSLELVSLIPSLHLIVTEGACGNVRRLSNKNSLMIGAVRPDSLQDGPAFHSQFTAHSPPHSTPQ